MEGDREECDGWRVTERMEGDKVEVNAVEGT